MGEFYKVRFAAKSQILRRFLSAHTHAQRLVCTHGNPGSAGSRSLLRQLIADSSHHDSQVGRPLASAVETPSVAQDWYRCESWSEADREQFEAKLRRARPDNRAQYVRIQGVTLAESADRKGRACAGELLERVIRDYPGDDLQIAMAHADLGRWHAANGRASEAVEHLRSAVALEDAMGNLDTGSDLNLAEVLVEMREPPADEVRSLLDRARTAGLAFKSQRWRCRERRG
jgi:hypothetical protein